MSAEEFHTAFDKFRDCTDKFESEFMFVCHDMTLDDLKNKIAHQMELVKTIKDGLRKHYIHCKLYDFQQYLEMQKDKPVNAVFLLHKDVATVPLHNDWHDILNEFGVDNYIFKYGDRFDLDYLQHLLLDNTYHNVIHVNNNTLSHYHLNRTKKKLVTKEEKKGMDLLEYMKPFPKEFFIIHGVSVAIKNLKTTESCIVNNGQLTDKEIFKMIDRQTNMKNSKALAEWLGYMTHPKLGSRLVFGNDISKKIVERSLKTLYCTKEFHEKVKTKVPADLQIFEIIIVHSHEPNDTGHKLKTDFSGAVGITFY